MARQEKNTNTRNEKTTESTRMWWEGLKAFQPKGYDKYVKQWLDSMEQVQEHVSEFQKSVAERTSNAMDETYRMAKAGFDRSLEFMDYLNEMTRSQIRHWRERF